MVRSPIEDYRKGVTSASEQSLRIVQARMFRDVEPVAVNDTSMAAMIDWASDRQPGQSLVRAWTPEIPGFPFSVVEIVTDDMPFLVDSVTAEMTRVGRSIHSIAHPQFAVTRVNGKLEEVHDRDITGIPSDMIAESWMHIYVERDFVSDDLDSLTQGLERVLADVRKAVMDWPLMRTKAIDISGDLRRNAPLGIEPSEVDEAIALLDWLTQDSFTFIGYREYLLVTIDGEDALSPVPNSGLGILRDSGEHARPSQSFAILPVAVRAKAREREVLVLSKANSRSTVHRPGYLDYVGVKIFNELGEVVGERRFLGLYAARAYSEAVLDIPVLREKARSVERRLGFVPDSHSAKDLEEFLDTYPRDELFQITVDRCRHSQVGSHIARAKTNQVISSK